MPNTTSGHKKNAQEIVLDKNRQSIAQNSIKQRKKYSTGKAQPGDTEHLPKEEDHIKRGNETKILDLVQKNGKNPQ